MATNRANIILKEDCSDLLSASVKTVINNEDLLTEILLHVPAKSLLKFKSVCKDWNKLISSLRFVNNQYARSTKLVSGIFFHHRNWGSDAFECLSLQGHLSSTKLPFLHKLRNRDRIRFEHYCNGLTLFKDFGSETYYVCNLTTREYVKLLPPYSHGIGCSRHACLAFDPLSSPYYKVVLLSNPICIYFSGSKSWRTVKVDEIPVYSPVAFCTGAIHWMEEKNIYFRFMVDEEMLITTQMPPKPKILKPDNIRFFGECGGRLLLIQCRLRSVMGFTILEMEKGTCWTVKHRVNLRRVPYVKPTKGRNFHVLSIIKGTSESDLTLVLATPCKLFSYNLRRQLLVFVCDFSFNEIEGIKHFSSYASSVGRCFPFSENLFPVNFPTSL